MYFTKNFDAVTSALSLALFLKAIYVCSTVHRAELMISRKVSTELCYA